MRAPKTLWLLLGALALLGCEQVGASTQPAAGKGKGPKASRPTAVAVAEVREGGISSFYATTATLESERTAPILARSKGMVKAIGFEEGDAVKTGAVLLRIDQADLALRLEQAEAKTAGLKDRYTRLEGLVAKDLAPTEEFETVKHDLRSAQAEEDLARLELSRTRVRAPFSGRVVRRLVEIGQTVNEDTVVFELADLDPLLARVHVPSKELKRIARDQPVTLQLDSTGAALEGHIKLVSPVIDPTTGTIKVTIEIAEYPEGTRPGDFAQVRIVTERREQRRLVPRTAVVEDRKDRVVFVAKDGAAERRVVEVGFEQDEVSEILSGVELGERVVTKGQHALKDGQPIKILEE